MTIEETVAGFINNLEERVDRLKTLEAAGGAGGDANIYHSNTDEPLDTDYIHAIPNGYDHAFEVTTWRHSFNFPISNITGGRGCWNTICFPVAPTFTRPEYWYSGVWSSSGTTINQADGDVKDYGAGPNDDAGTPIDSDVRSAGFHFHFDIQQTTYFKPQTAGWGSINDEVPLKGGTGLDLLNWMTTGALQVTARFSDIEIEPRVAATAVNFAAGTYCSLYVVD